MFQELSMKNLSHYQKIKQVLDIKGISVAKAEGLAGLGGGTIAKLKGRKDGKGELHDDNLQKFLRTFNVSESWWKTGVGDIFVAETQHNQPLEDLRRHITNLEKNLDDLRKNIEDLRLSGSDLRRFTINQEKTISLMEEAEKSADMVLDKYRRDLKDAYEKLEKQEQAARK